MSNLQVVEEEGNIQGRKILVSNSETMDQGVSSLKPPDLMQNLAKAASEDLLPEVDVSV